MELGEGDTYVGVFRGDVGHKRKGPSESFGPPGDKTHTEASSRTGRCVTRMEKRQVNLKGVQSQVSECGEWPGPSLED